MKPNISDLMIMWDTILVGIIRNSRRCKRLAIAYPIGTLMSHGGLLNRRP
jgi:hypothetical protein